ncbi:hypothetical protein ASPACDRAFT_48003 [Aspergillus aculeatus ATCC 16872]|uniref:Uncharacterized protein n=1 Tax=Aspergillus aculeatus (strain ATCC 16872 / CBS 172.66 / WB 5094) TaxID=690307 RepID=A0A1L9WGG2_ASPA1|nr:uncharacterized protein ASPACDRAFT_48003 [Aspergillus aculeatus ATCC 16872]OJJ95259.1 hypothetical protein ASPACDRAFT_48003 [Aspergillus aculeatus ATCC 16872]
MSTQLVVGVQSSLPVHLSDSAPLTQWPGMHGAPGQDEGNYLAVLFLAWAYILSARWAEIMEGVSGCTVPSSPADENQSDGQPGDHYTAAIELGYETDADETNWRRSILSGTSDSSPRTAEYNHRPSLSPWSVSLGQPSRIAVTDHQLPIPKHNNPPPSSHTALEYLTRFSTHHRFHAQTSAALAAALAAALYIPFLQGKGKSITLPIPHQALLLSPLLTAHPHTNATQCKSQPIASHALLPYYMTLSTNPWGIRSLLHSRFSDADIECNLVSAWLHPAFAVMHPPIHANDLPALLSVLAHRAPRLGGLWLGAFIEDVAGSILRDVRDGMAALDLIAEALSEVATRGIFGWLRSRGYPASERAIYQHEWLALASSDDEHEH